MSEATAILTVEKLCFARGACDVLREVDWTVSRGDFAAIVGENGAGKTTLLKCLCGILKPRLGRVEVEGRALSAYHSRELARRISYLPQADHRMLAHRVRDFVAMGRYPYLNPWNGMTAKDDAVVDEAMARVGVAQFAERTMTTLSGGERRKVSLAAALAQGAELLLLDEPATFLDPRHQVELRTILRQLNESGITIVMVTHDLNAMAAMADKVLALRHGAVDYAGTVADYLASPAVGATFGIEFDVVEASGGRRRIYPRDPA